MLRKRIAKQKRGKKKKCKQAEKLNYINGIRKWRIEG